MIQELKLEQKVDILISAIEERYNVLHKIRERVQSVGLWAIGLSLSSGGWLIQSGLSLTPSQKFFYISGILLATYFLRQNYLEDLRKGFKAQQLVTAKLEKALGLFEIGMFDNEKESIFPKSWEQAGQKNGGGNFFKTTFLLLYLAVSFMALSIYFAKAPNEVNVVSDNVLKFEATK